MGQVWYRKMQNLGLSQDYKDSDSEISKWLKSFGLHFLDPTEVEDCFVQKLQSVTYVKIRSSTQPAMSRKSERDRTDYTIAQFSKDSAGEIIRLDYIKSLGYRFLARTDM